MTVKQYFDKYGYEKTSENEFNINFVNCVVLGSDKTSTGEIKIFKLDDISDEERNDIDFQSFLKSIQL